MAKLDYETLKQRLMAIPNNRDRALLCLIYATGGRVGEIVWHRKYEQKPVQKKDIKNYTSTFEIFVFTEKIHIYRRVILNKEVEPWLINIIELYSRAFTEDQYLFPMTTRNAQKIFRKYFPEINVSRNDKVLGQTIQGIHLMRKWRATHMKLNKTVLPGERCEEKFIMFQLGWKRSDSLNAVYDQTELDDYLYLVKRPDDVSE